jgi:probable addiction module antidote protein
VAAHYLNAAMNDSPEMFLKALRNVAEAHKMATVAKKASVAREALYKTLSEEGNPRLATLRGVLKAVGLRIAVEPAEQIAPSPGTPLELVGSYQAATVTKPDSKLSGIDAKELKQMVVRLDFARIKFAELLPEGDYKIIQPSIPKDFRYKKLDDDQYATSLQ